MPLLEAFIRCYSRAGDLVVDPFAGGGTTVVMAKRLGRRAIGYECNPEAVELARRNIGGAAS
jgi:DNA modification methylase